MSEPLFDANRGRYIVAWGAPEYVTLIFEQVRRDRRDGQIAEFTAESTAPGYEGLLHHAKLNLQSTQTRKTLAQYLDSRTPGQALDWNGLLEVACKRVVDTDRAGEPAILLRDAEQPPDAGWLLSPLVIGQLPTVIFGDGSSGKSLLLLAAALDIHAGTGLLGLGYPEPLRVAYLDFEFSAWEHRERMRGLLGEGTLPDMLYVPCTSPLRDDVDRLHGIFREHGVQYVVIDSLGFACDGPPEDAASALGVYAALRQLGVGALCAAHTNRQQDAERPFGSAFWHNGARLTWYAKKQQDAGTDAITVGLFNKKSNAGPLARPLGYRLTFTEDRIEVERANVRDTPELATELPLKDRIASLVGAGPRTYQEIAEALDAPIDSVRVLVNRFDSRPFVRLTGIDRMIRVTLTHPDSPNMLSNSYITVTDPFSEEGVTAGAEGGPQGPTPAVTPSSSQDQNPGHNTSVTARNSSPNLRSNSSVTPGGETPLGGLPDLVMPPARAREEHCPRCGTICRPTGRGLTCPHCSQEARA